MAEVLDVVVALDEVNDAAEVLDAEACDVAAHEVGREGHVVHEHLQLDRASGDALLHQASSYEAHLDQGRLVRHRRNLSCVNEFSIFSIYEDK